MRSGYCYLETVLTVFLLLVVFQGVLPQRLLRHGRLRAHHLAGPLLLDGGEREGFDVAVTDVRSLQVGGGGQGVGSPRTITTTLCFNDWLDFGTFPLS